MPKVNPLAKAWESNPKPLLNKHKLRHRNRQIKDHLNLVRPIARHYSRQTGFDQDDLLQVGCLGLIKASTRYDPERGATFPSYAKPHIRGAILHFLRDSVGLIRLPRAIEERAMQATREPEHCTNAADALAVHHYRHKHHWVEFNDDLVDETPVGLELVERSETWTRVEKVFRRIDRMDQKAIQMVVIEGMSLRQTAQQLGVSAMTVQRRVKRGLKSISDGFRASQMEV